MRSRRLSASITAPGPGRLGETERFVPFAGGASFCESGPLGPCSSVTPEPGAYARTTSASYLACLGSPPAARGPSRSMAPRALKPAFDPGAAATVVWRAASLASAATIASRCSRRACLARRSRTSASIAARRRSACRSPARDAVSLGPASTSAAPRICTISISGRNVQRSMARLATPARPIASDSGTSAAKDQKSVALRRRVRTDWPHNTEREYCVRGSRICRSCARRNMGRSVPSASCGTSAD